MKKWYIVQVLTGVEDQVVSDSKARINLGIRRRLSPLLGNDRKKIELMV